MVRRVWAGNYSTLGNKLGLSVNSSHAPMVRRVRAGNYSALGNKLGLSPRFKATVQILIKLVMSAGSF